MLDNVESVADNLSTVVSLLGKLTGVNADLWRCPGISDKKGGCMEHVNPNLITCIVQRGEADQVVAAAMQAGAQGATIYYGRGTGVREKLGFAGMFIKPEKEIILIVAKEEQTEAVFEAVVKAARLEKKGQGFAFLHKLDRAVGFVTE